MQMGLFAQISIDGLLGALGKAGPEWIIIGVLLLINSNMFRSMMGVMRDNTMTLAILVEMMRAKKMADWDEQWDKVARRKGRRGDEKE